MSRKILCLALLSIVSALSVAAEDDAPAFGPESFVLTGASETYTASFPAAGGDFVLYVRNGDGEGGRADSVAVSINGVTVVDSSELTIDDAGTRRPVALRSGDNDLTVDVAGAPGAFVTLAIAPPGHRPRFVIGRLLLPWGRNDDDRSLRLALKNGSARHPRRVRIVFFNPDGTVAGAAARITLPPHGSLATDVDALIASTAWQGGSVELVYSGRGSARVFGSARQLDLPPLTEAEVQPLHPAGFQLFRGQPDPPQGVVGRRRGY